VEAQNGAVADDPVRPGWREWTSAFGKAVGTPPRTKEPN